jgi:cytochrome P450
MVFGGGSHFCAGAILARRIVAGSLRAFMERYPNMAPADPSWRPRYDGQLGETAPQELLVNLA